MKKQTKLAVVAGITICAGSSAVASTNTQEAKDVTEVVSSEAVKLGQMPTIKVESPDFDKETPDNFIELADDNRTKKKRVPRMKSFIDWLFSFSEEESKKDSQFS